MSKLTPESQLKRVEAYLVKLQQQKFYGKVTLDIQAGNILRIEQKKSTLLEDVDGQPSPKAQAHGR